MVRFKRGKAAVVLEEEADSRQDNIVEEPFALLQKLANEEARLIEEKKNLDSLKEKLLSKIQKEINNKSKNIQKLKSEIKDLKFSCEELTKTFKASAKVK